MKSVVIPRIFVSSAAWQLIQTGRRGYAWLIQLPPAGRGLIQALCPTGALVRSKIRWRAIFVTSVSAAGVFVLAICSPLIVDQARNLSSFSSHPRPATDDEQKEVFRAVLVDVFKQGVPPPVPTPSEPVRQSARRTIVLLPQLLVLCSGEVKPSEAPSNCIAANAADVASSSPLGDKIAKELLPELRAINHRAATISDPHIREVVFWPGDGTKQMFLPLNDTSLIDDRFPNSQGYLFITRAAVSHDGMKALVLVSRHCVWKCGSNQLYSLTRIGNTWRIIGTNLL